MRTTLTIDDDVMARLQKEAHRRRVSLRHVVNEALRRAMADGARPRKAAPLRSYASKLRTGFDPSGFNHLADELEAEAVARRLPGRR